MQFLIPWPPGPSKTVPLVAFPVGPVAIRKTRVEWAFLKAKWPFKRLGSTRIPLNKVLVSLNLAAAHNRQLTNQRIAINPAEH